MDNEYNDGRTLKQKASNGDLTEAITGINYTFEQETIKIVII